ncbi:hypothetical protein AXF42_Ash006390 [Apostasia shenzhenica]|uniref:Uncharacterized protein n=1 Tax=Apostasia shenzhenica TaxID=1088818 RepID=A0A2I0AZ04_9ASPA|nr:hypothetical protein AXF42_Ash006390 [Apostasia shenzhenica]
MGRKERGKDFVAHLMGGRRKEFMAELLREILPSLSLHLLRSRCPCRPRNFRRISDREMAKLKASQKMDLAEQRISDDSASMQSQKHHESDIDSVKQEEKCKAMDEKNNSNQIVTGTEDDKKNVMDLGSSDMERNRNLESLIARRRARKNQIIIFEKDLIDLNINDSRMDELSFFILKSDLFLLQGEILLIFPMGTNMQANEEVAIKLSGSFSSSSVPSPIRYLLERRYAAFQFFKRFKRCRPPNRETRPSFGACGVTEVRRFRTESRARLHLLMSSRQCVLQDLCASSIRPTVAKTLDLRPPDRPLHE